MRTTSLPESSRSNFASDLIIVSGWVESFLLSSMFGFRVLPNTAESEKPPTVSRGSACEKLGELLRNDLCWEYRPTSADASGLPRSDRANGSRRRKM
ncbi:hypothetical protein ElyMa_005855400 [Elysia marginata]|uniref:Uncharacterized protein n=1 Tax=Elysia marginata TaxID=1093978 RepID=A0AAV4G0L7_9GAST|nr:hypothetical protein ElyMa_005855400 [Elysia marginata]